MRLSTLACTAALVCAATAAQAATPIELVIDFQPTRLELTRDYRLVQTSPPLTGTIAEAYNMRFVVEEDSRSPSNLSNGYRVLSFRPVSGSAPWTPYMLAQLPPQAMGTPGRPWNFAETGLSFTANVAGESGPLQTHLVRNLFDGYDTMGVVPASPSWIFYNSALDLSQTGPLTSKAELNAMPLNTEVVFDWLQAAQGLTFKDAFSETIKLSGGAYVSTLKADVTIRSVSLVPETSALPMFALGLLAVGVGHARHQRRRGTSA